MVGGVSAREFSCRVSRFGCCVSGRWLKQLLWFFGGLVLFVVWYWCSAVRWLGGWSVGAGGCRWVQVGLVGVTVGVTVGSVGGRTSS